MNTDRQTHQPIGYWLNRADEALTKRMNQLLESHGLTRVGWQVLNVLQPEAGLPEAQVYEVLQANASATTLGETVGDLVAKGWVARLHENDNVPKPILKLTDAGRAHNARVQEPITQFRQRSMQGITTEEYQMALSVLERIIQNVA